MKIVLFPVTTDRANVDPFEDLVREINNRSSRATLNCKLFAIVMLPVIADPAVFRTSDSVRYKKKENSLFVTCNTSFGEWQLSGMKRRKKLAVALFVKMFEMIPGKYIADSDRQRLIEWTLEAG